VNPRRTLPKRVQGRFASEKHRRLRRSTPFASCRKLSCIADLERLQIRKSRLNRGDSNHHCSRRATSLDLNLDEVSADQVRECVSRYCEQQQKFLRLVLIDAEREYDEGSRVGFGLDGDAKAADDDFKAVRGNFAENSFVKQVTAEIESLPARCEAVSNQIEG
jgi:Domain of unknown function (DUF4954)